MYVSDSNNHRVMKWNRGANQGIVVAGGQGKGSTLTHLYYPQGLFVDIIRYNLCGQMHGMILLSVLSPMKYHETN